MCWASERISFTKPLATADRPNFCDPKPPALLLVDLSRRPPGPAKIRHPTKKLLVPFTHPLTRPRPLVESLAGVTSSSSRRVTTPRRAPNPPPRPPLTNPRRQRYGVVYRSDCLQSPCVPSPSPSLLSRLPACQLTSRLLLVGHRPTDASGRDCRGQRFARLPGSQAAPRVAASQAKKGKEPERRHMVQCAPAHLACVPYACR